MNGEQRAALRRLRGDRSLRAFAEHLVASGLPPDLLSRQRLSRVEQGSADLPPALWQAIASALLASGIPFDDIAPLLPRTVAEPVPPSTPALRRQQWARLLDRLPGNRWWRTPSTLILRLAGAEWVRRYNELVAEHGIDPEAHRREVLRRLAHGRTTRPSSDDAVTILDHGSDLSVRIGRGELFVLRARLRNCGETPWRDRLLYRLGPPVTSSLPFAAGLLPIPDTDPGGACDILIPGRGQWFPNLAVLSYAMVFADCTPCLPGVLQCLVDTRSETAFDHTLRLPDGVG